MLPQHLHDTNFGERKQLRKNKRNGEDDIKDASKSQSKGKKRAARA
jgi:hypothetical protein